MKKISNKPKDWLKAVLVTSFGLIIFNIISDLEILFELLFVNLVSSFSGYILFEAINISIYNKKVKDKFKYKIIDEEPYYMKALKNNIPEIIEKLNK